MTDAELEQYIAQLRARNAQQQAQDAQEQARRDYYGQDASTGWQRLLAILRGERPTRETNEQWRARMVAGYPAPSPQVAAGAIGGMLPAYGAAPRRQPLAATGGMLPVGY